MPVADVYKQKLSIGTKSSRSIWFTSLCTRESSRNGNSPRTWQSRSRIGVYVVHSTLHSGIRVLVLNPKREFITVNQNLDKTKISMDKQLQHLFTSEQRNFSDDHEENVTQRHHIDSTWWPVMTQIRSWREEILKHETSVKVQQTRMHTSQRKTRKHNMSTNLRISNTERKYYDGYGFPREMPRCNHSYA
jgi:hypothetical protein